MKKIIALSAVLVMGALGMACGESANNANANANKMVANALNAANAAAAHRDAITLHANSGQNLIPSPVASAVMATIAAVFLIFVLRIPSDSCTQNLERSI